MPKTCGHFGDGHWPAPTVLAKNRINEAGLSLTLADEFTPGIHESGFTLAQLRQPGPTARSEPISGRLRAAHPAPDGKIVHGVGPVTTPRGEAEMAEDRLCGAATMPDRVSRDRQRAIRWAKPCQ
jgi:hypothetical protein